MLSKPSARRALSLLSIALSTTLLAACQTPPFSRTTCPPLVTYSPEFQRRAASELQALPAGSAVGAMIVDYGKARDACRAIRG